ALRSVLRQDPDIVLIGEIRDHETADIAVKFSLTGHLVFTTLHANDSTSTITRLVDIGIPAFLVGSSLNLVMAQRLVRLICEHCKSDHKPKDHEILEAGLTLEEAKDIKFKIGRGCVHCDNTGYRGRTGIFELLEVKKNIRSLIFDNQNQDKIRQAALDNGMVTLNVSTQRKMREGVTTIREVIKLTMAESD
ncbi:MAG: Flp pilus assembly complex ATPase component TadA, partial [Candidatus Cloacimonetes bacterium]|nr:Flp pilus assembly complex ATPase component TadA [Candidatus Cloacimonadota bacterium]